LLYFLLYLALCKVKTTPLVWIITSGVLFIHQGSNLLHQGSNLLHRGSNLLHRESNLLHTFNTRRSKIMLACIWLKYICLKWQKVLHFWNVTVTVTKLRHLFYSFNSKLTQIGLPKLVLWTVCYKKVGVFS
jgi:hypothetical protein